MCCSEQQEELRGVLLCKKRPAGAGAVSEQEDPLNPLLLLTFTDSLMEEASSTPPLRWEGPCLL